MKQHKLSNISLTYHTAYATDHMEALFFPTITPINYKQTENILCIYDKTNFTLLSTRLYNSVTLWFLQASQLIYFTHTILGPLRSLH